MIFHPSELRKSPCEYMFEQRKFPFGVKTVSMATPEEKRTNMNFFAVKAALLTRETRTSFGGSPGWLIKGDQKTISGCDKRKQRLAE